MAKLPEEYSFDCFFYYEGVQKCYSCGEGKIRYCTNEQLDELKGRWVILDYETLDIYGSRRFWEGCPYELDAEIIRHKDDEFQWWKERGLSFEYSSLNRL